MAVNLGNYEEQARSAVMQFWQARGDAMAAQEARQAQDAGTRGAVTAGKHMDGFIKLIHTIVLANGLTEGDVHLTRNTTILPGYYRATKSWDLIIVHRKVLVAAVELKSQVGSVPKNVNNRIEEVLGSATDLWDAFEQGAFGTSRPFLGYLLVLEDNAAVKTPVGTSEPHFPVFPEFNGASYQKRYQLLCERLVKQGRYDAAAFLMTPADEGLASGTYSEPDPAIGLRNLLAELAGRSATVAARTE